MLTTADNPLTLLAPVDAGATPRAVLWSIASIAKRDGVSKQAVSKSVKKLAERNGLAVERNPIGHIVSVNVADYDRLRGRFGDPSKAQAPASARPQAPHPVSPAESYDEALRTKTWLEAERKRLDLEEQKGNLVRVSRVGDAVAACGEAIVHVVDRLPNIADELAVAFTRDGVHGLRLALKAHARRQRGEIAEQLASVAGGAPREEGAGGALA